MRYCGQLACWAVLLGKRLNHTECSGHLTWEHHWITGISFLCCFSVSYRRRRYRLRPRSPLASAPANTVPGVSILRPLKGLDTNLYENLESTFTQEYPNYELLFSVADPNDQALAVVRELIARYPHVKAEIVLGEAYPTSSSISFSYSLRVS